MKTQHKGFPVRAFTAAVALLLAAFGANASDIQNQFLPGVQKTFVNDSLGLGTGTDVSCFIPLAPSGTTSLFAACGNNQAIIAIPNNDSKLFNAIMAAKINGSPIWILFDRAGPTYSCGPAIGTTNCSVITFSLQ